MDPVVVSLLHHPGQLEAAYAGARGLGKGRLVWQRHIKILESVTIHAPLFYFLNVVRMISCLEQRKVQRTRGAAQLVGRRRGKGRCGRRLRSGTPCVLQVKGHTTIATPDLAVQFRYPMALTHYTQ